jgi:hypothetical protein
MALYCIAHGRSSWNLAYMSNLNPCTALKYLHPPLLPSVWEKRCTISLDTWKIVQHATGGKSNGAMTSSKGFHCNCVSVMKRSSQRTVCPGCPLRILLNNASTSKDSRRRWSYRSEAGILRICDVFLTKPVNFWDSPRDSRRPWSYRSEAGILFICDVFLTKTINFWDSPRALRPLPCCRRLHPPSAPCQLPLLLYLASA